MAPTVVDPESSNGADRKTWRFWIAFLSCCLLALLVSLDGTVVVIALPKITSELHIGGEYVWIFNSFWLAGTAIQPLVAQLSDGFGRKLPLLISLAIFFVGGAVAGSATTSTQLIAGRAVQGLGGGGLLLLMEVVVCDIISLRERGKYMGIVFGMAAVGAVVGPPIGGAIADRNWRWIFYMNLPIAGTIFLIWILLVKLKEREQVIAGEVLSRVDWFGTALLCGLTTSIVLGLVFGANNYPWNSWRVILPLVLGSASMPLYIWCEGRCAYPSMPFHLFRNRTSAAGYAMIFLQSMLTTWITFVWPTFFQAVLQASPLKAGNNYLVFEAFLIPAAGVSGSLVSKTGQYRALQFTGFAFLTLSSGVSCLLGANTSVVNWVCLLAVTAMGLGMVLPTMLPAILVALPEKDVAIGTGAYSFLRSFGYIWGATLPAVIFDASFSRYGREIEDKDLLLGLSQGRAYQHISGESLMHLPYSTRLEVIGVYMSSLKVVWATAAAFSCCGVLLVFAIKHVPLRKELRSEYGFETGEGVDDEN